MALDASVVICTRDRAAQLRAALESACALRIPPGTAWELLVVDNGSGDSTAETALSFASRLPLRLVSEPVPSLCPARNRGAAEAKGRYLCWIDDDVLLDPDWLAAYLAAFRNHPEAAIFGGRILPRLDPPAPAWFARRMYEWPVANLVALRDMGDEESPVALEGGRLPWGANYAIRAEEQKLYAYKPEIGFSPRHVRRTGEETDLIYRILRDGGSGWWVPDCRVRHVIPAERQTLAYLEFYFEQAGRTAAWLEEHFPGDNANAVYGRPAFDVMPDPVLRLVAAGSGLVSRAAALAGLERAALRFRARGAYYGGVAGHRHDRTEPARRLTGAGAPRIEEVR
ncbi:MAG TPA: glycosyltransferase [Allosphingosinicella sp.]